MKRLLRTIVTLSLIGGMSLGATLSTARSVLALSREAIIEKLSGVPVFMIVDQEGRSLTANVGQNSQEVAVPIVFISVASAEQFLARAQAENAPIGASGQVAILSLGSLYQEARTQLSNGQQVLYVPSQDAVTAARSIANGQEFPGVPLFAAINTQNNQYLLTAEGLLPVYFSLADLQAAINAAITSNPELRSIVGIEVLTLEGLIAGMESNDRELDQLLERVRLIPDSRILERLRQAEPGQSNQPAQPQPAQPQPNQPRPQQRR